MPPVTMVWTAVMCSGVVPQQPPTMARPYSSMKVFSEAASSAGFSGYSAPFFPRMGRPALGMTETGMRALRDR